jgi:hypothetical protein
MDLEKNEARNDYAGEGPHASARNLRRSYNESDVRENDSSSMAFSSLVTVCWIDETTSSLVLFTAIFK